METRLLEFIHGLRGAGVRISVAESADAFRAVQKVGVLDRPQFQEALRLTLIKKVGDEVYFEELFPIYFGHERLQMVNLMEKLSPEELKLLRRAVRSLMDQLKARREEEATRFGRHAQYGQAGDSTPDSPDSMEAMQQILETLLAGQMPDRAMFSQSLAQTLGQHDYPFERDRRWLFERRMINRLGGPGLPQIQRDLPAHLRQAGLSQARIDRIDAAFNQNLDALKEEAAEQLERHLARHWAEQQAREVNQAEALMQRQLLGLSEREVKLLRQQLRRLASRLRSQIALRQKHRRRGVLDVRKTLRHNMRYGGVPVELKFKTRLQKPRLLLLCDISNSMRRIVAFALRLVYELQDQVANVRTLTYIDTLADVSQDFAQHSPEIAVEQAMARLPPRHPNTDLGQCLVELFQTYPELVDRRTTVLIIGDACNSWNDPRLDLMAQLQRASKAIIWFNPQEKSRWGMADSDMIKYLPYAQAVHRVSTLAELAHAVDSLLT